MKRIRDNLKPRHKYLRLDYNERFIKFPTWFYLEFLQSLTQDDFMAYPEPKPLYDKLAEYHDVNFENIYLAPGSDAVIKTFFEAFVSQGDIVVSSEPCFPMYKVYSELFKANFLGIEYTEDYKFKLDELLEFLSYNETSLIILANPNSPIGNYIPYNTIEAIAAFGIPLLIDEAYVEFVGETCRDLIRKYNNVGIVRTFSKAFGAAGLRVGYAIGSEWLINKLFEWRQMDEVNQIGIKFACHLLDHIDLITHYCNECILEREKLSDIMLNNGFQVLDSLAGWIHINHKDALKQRELIKNLTDRGALLKLVKLPHDSRKNWIRLSIGPGISTLFK